MSITYLRREHRRGRWTTSREKRRTKKKRGSLRRPANDQRPTTNDCLRPLAPPRQILFLLRRELVDFNSHRLEFQLGHPLIQVIRHSIHFLLQRLVVLHHVIDR